MVSPRQNQIQHFKSQKFDLLVIGGGITGAGIALDAASRGLHVALVEKGDFASGTSSKSTKLIHGGLRYLKQFELKMVHDVGCERAIVHGLAPHLVKPEKMFLPIYQGGTFGKLGTSLGLWLYDFLAGVKKEDRRKMLNRKQALEDGALLRKEGLLGAGLYAEYRTDDARLTIEVLKTAIRHGATCLNYTEVIEFMEENGQLIGVACHDLPIQEVFQIKATTIVNAAGPWVDKLREKANSLTNKRLFLSKGTHIVVPKERLPLRHAVYFDVADGRMVFAIPRQRATYIGTTDTPYKGSREAVFAEIGEVKYLLDAANAMFPTAKLTLPDVESTWAGLRPLIYEEGKSAGEMSRKDEIFISKSGLISVAGGKLTGYRKMAEKLVDLVLKRQGQTPIVCMTKHIALAEEPFANMEEVLDFQRFIEERIRHLEDAETMAVYLTENYGRFAEQIVDAAFGKGEETAEALVKAELHYCLDSEFVLNPLDFFERRTGMLYFHAQRVHRYLETVLQVFQSHFNWSSKELETQRQTVQDVLKKLRPWSA
ncbi:MAG: glycerol-3-phosphate dehydrogenase/oxidase [Saprospiraceae bacterium]|nr:glycerol-3-phosphate dehydrogenase/oxidase [Saprospiraceae bacterium]MCF8252484.1 glycerol-3-phosphate dehydrogenase/oxidase [Saprospiraceae bacterium]MCF8312649.1 glycerol-3-phosphate dehydrogenase/oxidase [Saprospiraceae bacterium]MCF8441085.1 glycerol-3-phosphate dehydrogenase/oxidase [Saprospiraceae bacterium]